MKGHPLPLVNRHESIQKGAKRWTHVQRSRVHLSELEPAVWCSQERRPIKLKATPARRELSHSATFGRAWFVRTQFPSAAN